MVSSKLFTSAETIMQLSSSLVRLCAYTKILQYLSRAKRYYEQHSIELFLKTALSLDEDLGSVTTGIKHEREEIERLRGMVDGQQDKE
jgi:hypothetical protein